MSWPIKRVWNGSNVSGGGNLIELYALCVNMECWQSTFKTVYVVNRHISEIYISKLIDVIRYLSEFENIYISCITSTLSECNITELRSSRKTQSSCSMPFCWGSEFDHRILRSIILRGCTNCSDTSSKSTCDIGIINTFVICDSHWAHINSAIELINKV